MTRRDRGRGASPSWLSDDFDDETFFRDSRRRTRDRKTAQLCAQARRALAWALESELGDARLSELVVAEVRPNPDASHLLVVATGPLGTDLSLAQQSLSCAASHLREALARGLSRKRVPVLSFVVLPEGGETYG